MRKFESMIAVAAAVLTMGSCGNKGQQVTYDYGDSVEVVPYIDRDTTVYGICGDGSAMNTLQLLTDSGDTLNLSVEEAKDADQCFGGFSAGDRMAVLLKDKATAQLVINLSTLMGNWVMPNPLDGSSETGFRIKEGGIVEGIDQGSIIFKSWRIYNGQLEMVMIREGGTEEEETYRYSLVTLGADSLVIKDDEDVYEYGRQQERKPNSRIKLEEASADDYRI